MEPITIPQSCSLGVGSTLSGYDLRETLAVGMDICGGRFNTGGRNGSMTKMEESQVEWRDIITRRDGSFQGTCGHGRKLGTHSVR